MVLVLDEIASKIYVRITSMRTPDFVRINLSELVLLLNYKQIASTEIGELGDEIYEETLAAIDRQSKISVTPKQLADLIYHMKECFLDKIKAPRISLKIKNYNHLMRELKDQVPQLFKELPSGEIEMINLEERTYS